MNKNFALYNHEFNIFFEDKFQDYQTRIYNLNYDCYSITAFMDNVIDSILNNIADYDNHNRIENEKTTYLFSYTEEKKKVMFIKFELLEMKLKVSVILENNRYLEKQVEYNRFWRNQNDKKQQPISKSSYDKFFKVLDKEVIEIKKEYEEEIQNINKYFLKKRNKYNLPSINFLKKHKNKISLKEIIESENFKNSQSLLTLALGIKQDGNSYVYDLTKMPNLLIAGSNKAEIKGCINNIILSILYKAKFEEIDFILFDTKNELSVYKRISRIYNFDKKEDFFGENKIYDTFHSLITLMEKRYNKYINNAVRNIKEYNSKMILKGKNKDKNIIIIINNSLIELYKKNIIMCHAIQDYILKLTQLGNIVGIHLILATQTLTDKVITDEFRLNFTSSRLAFKTNSVQESILLLDCPGAEKLTDKGDMLFLPQSKMKPIHLQCPYVSTKEVEQVIKFLNKQNSLTKTKL